LIWLLGEGRNGNVEMDRIRWLNMYKISNEETNGRNVGVLEGHEIGKRYDG